MIKPVFPTIVILTPEEIADTRAFYKMSREKFARFLPVSGRTIKSWENGTRNPYGPAAVRLAELKAYADHVTASKKAAFDNIMKKAKLKKD